MSMPCLNAALQVPIAHEVIAVVRSTDDMIEAFRAIKGQLGLSNVLCDKLAGLAEDHTNKILGPRRVKNLGPMTFDIFCELFGVEFQMVINLDAVRRMESRWEQRNNERVRTENRRPGREVIERVKPYVLREIGRRGGLKTASLPSRKQVARKGGFARAKKLPKARRREIASKAGKASAVKRAIVAAERAAMLLLEQHPDLPALQSPSPNGEQAAATHQRA